MSNLCSLDSFVFLGCRLRTTLNVAKVYDRVPAKRRLNRQFYFDRTAIIFPWKSNQFENLHSCNFQRFNISINVASTPPPPPRLEIQEQNLYERRWTLSLVSHIFASFLITYKNSILLIYPRSTFKWIARRCIPTKFHRWSFKCVWSLNAFTRGSNVARPKCMISRNESQNKILLVYSGTKRSTTSEGLTEKLAGPLHDVEKRKKKKTLTMAWRIARISKTLILKQVPKLFTVFIFLWKESRKNRLNRYWKYPHAIVSSSVNRTSAASYILPHTVGLCRTWMI